MPPLFLAMDDLFMNPTESGVYMGLASQAGVVRHMYLWQGQAPPKLPRDPCYFEPIGDRKQFWKAGHVVWENTESALAGLTTLRGSKVPVYDYKRLRNSLSDYIQGVSNVTTDNEVVSILRRLMSEDHGKRTPVILLPPGFKQEDLEPTKPKPIKLGSVMGPPKV